MSGHEDYFEQPCGYTFNEVAKLQEESRLTGKREVVDWVEQHIPKTLANLVGFWHVWQAKLEEWGIKEE